MVSTMYTATGSNVMKTIALGGNNSHTPVVDYNGDGHLDITLEHTNGSVAVRNTDGTNVLGTTNMLGGGNDFRLVKTTSVSGQSAMAADFNGDHTTDLLWQNDYGMLSALEIRNNQVIDSKDLGTLYIGHSVVAAGDFFGTGKSDLLVQWSGAGLKPVYGEIWKGGEQANHVEVYAPNPGEKLVGVGDFNGDGRIDVLFQEMDGTLVVDNPSKQGPAIGTSGHVMYSNIPDGVLGNPDTDGFWHAWKVGDFNGDGHADILMRGNNNDYKIDLMRNGQIHSEIQLGNWGAIIMKDVRDVNGDHKDDLIGEGPNGEFYAWNMTQNGLVAGIIGLMPEKDGWQYVF